MSERETFFEQPTEHESDRAWGGMQHDFQRIEVWHKAGQNSFEAAAGSLIDVVDGLTQPHQVSHLIGYLLHTAVDHLHALKSLLVDAKTQHAFAPYNLVRGAIEAASTVLWILHDDEPHHITRRTLTLEFMNLSDQRRAVRTVDPEGGWDEDRLRVLEKVLRRNDLTAKKVQNGPTVTKIIDTAAEHFTIPTARLAWQMCSAAAHGRTWAKQFLTLFEVAGDDGISKTLSGQLTSNQITIAVALKTACNILEKALIVRKRYSLNANHSGASFGRTPPQLHVVKRALYVP